MTDMPTTEETPAGKSDRYEEARGLAEHALDEYARGRKTEGDALAEQAVKTDRTAVEDVVRELEEDEETATRDAQTQDGAA